MGGETQGGWIGSTVRRKGRVVLGIGILTRRHRKTYTSHTSYPSETVSPKWILAWLDTLLCKKKAHCFGIPFISLPLRLSGAEMNLKNNPDRPCWMAKPP